MSAGSKTVKYVAAAITLAAVIIVASFLYMAGPGATSTSPSTSAIAGQSVLAIQLTDPPQVPLGTRSLNLTYSAVNLLVGEPASNSQVTTSTISITPSGGSATIDLLTLQNISQTVASAKLPTGSTVYATSFTVQSITININGTVSTVTLATGGNTLGVTLAHPALLQGDCDVLLELNPVVVDTPTGYQLIPSIVGIVKPFSEFHPGDENIGTRRQIGQHDQGELNQAGGQISSSLVSLAVSGNTTTFTVQVNNTGSEPVSLIAVGLQGNFTSQSGCPHGNGQGDQGDHGKGNGDFDFMHGCGQHNEVVFIPVAPATTNPSSTTTTSKSSATCSSGQLTLIGGEGDDGERGGLAIAPGECINLTFTGTIAFGQSGPIIPSTQAGQTYVVHVIASNDAQMKLGCSLPFAAARCMTVHGDDDSG